MRALFLSLVVMMCAWLSWPATGECADSASADAAEIVLVGAAQDAAELQAVVAELLQREGVTPLFTRAERFAPDALLGAPDADGRVRVFITLPTPLLAKLYLRGPFGQRFLLRELTLRSGTDELGRESIAQVVATSTRALLHTDAGIDREAARADLAREAPQEPAVTPPPSPAQPVSPRAEAPVHFEISARGTLVYTGSALGERLGGGLELGLLQRPGGRALLRERALFEQSFAQTLESPELLAEVRTSSLRAGLDLGLALGTRALWLGLALGADLVHIAPDAVRDPSWTLAKQQTDAVPMLRAELRYERVFRSMLLGISAYVDVALMAHAFEIQDGDDVRPIATPWRISPGVALSLGWRSH